MGARPVVMISLGLESCRAPRIGVFEIGTPILGLWKKCLTSCGDEGAGLFFFFFFFHFDGSGKK